MDDGAIEIAEALAAFVSEAGDAGESIAFMLRDHIENDGANTGLLFAFHAMQQDEIPPIPADLHRRLLAWIGSLREGWKETYLRYLDGCKVGE